MESDTVAGKLFEGYFVEHGRHITVEIPGALDLIKQLRRASVDCHGTARMHLFCNDYGAIRRDLGDGVADVGPAAVRKMFERLEAAVIASADVIAALDHCWTHQLYDR